MQTSSSEPTTLASASPAPPPTRITPPNPSVSVRASCFTSTSSSLSNNASTLRSRADSLILRQNHTIPRPLRTAPFNPGALGLAPIGRAGNRVDVVALHAAERVLLKLHVTIAIQHVLAVAVVIARIRLL